MDENAQAGQRSGAREAVALPTIRLGSSSQGAVGAKSRGVWRIGVHGGAPARPRYFRKRCLKRHPGNRLIVVWQLVATVPFAQSLKTRLGKRPSGSDSPSE